MKSIEELEKYLEDECYSFVEINIGKHHAHEGIVIEKNGDAYEFGYSERGNKRILKLPDYEGKQNQNARYDGAGSRTMHATFLDIQLIPDERSPDGLR